MRERISRGKRVDNGEWIYWDRYGRITDINGKPTKTKIDIPTLHPYPTYIADLPIIDDDTVGDYTGLTDKNGKKIFEGDIVTYIGEVCLVKWDDETAKFVLENENLVCDFEEVWCNRLKSQIEVIGTIYDNPESSDTENFIVFTPPIS